MEYIIRQLKYEEIAVAINMMCGVFDKENIFPGYRHKEIEKSLNLAFISNDRTYCATYFVAIKTDDLCNEIVGIGGIKESFISDNVFELCWLTVRHDCQGQGIGKALILARIDHAKQVSGNDDVRILTGTIVPEMFKKLGFIEFMPPEEDGSYLYLKCNKSGKLLVNLYCESCGQKFLSKEPLRCCDGRDCGCMGQPTEPIVCSSVCYKEVFNRYKPK